MRKDKVKMERYISKSMRNLTAGTRVIIVTSDYRVLEVTNGYDEFHDWYELKNTETGEVEYLSPADLIGNYYAD